MKTTTSHTNTSTSQSSAASGATAASSAVTASAKSMPLLSFPYTCTRPIPNFGEVMYRIVTFAVEHYPETVQWTPKGVAFEVACQTILQQMQWREVVNQFLPGITDFQFEYQLILHGWWERPIINNNNNNDNDDEPPKQDSRRQYWNADFHRDRNSPKELAMIRPKPSARSEVLRNLIVSSSNQSNYYQLQQQRLESSQTLSNAEHVRQKTSQQQSTIIMQEETIEPAGVAADGVRRSLMMVPIDSTKSSNHSHDHCDKNPPTESSSSEKHLEQMQQTLQGATRESSGNNQDNNIMTVDGNVDCGNGGDEEDHDEGNPDIVLAHEDSKSSEDEAGLLCSEEMPQYDDECIDMEDSLDNGGIAISAFVDNIGSSSYGASDDEQEQPPLALSRSDAPIASADLELPTPVMHNKSRPRTNSIVQRATGTVGEQKEGHEESADILEGTTFDDENDEDTNDGKSIEEGVGVMTLQHLPQTRLLPQRLDNDTLWGLSENFVYNWDSLQLGDQVGSVAVKSLLELQTLQQYLLLKDPKSGLEHDVLSNAGKRRRIGQHQFQQQPRRQRQKRPANHQCYDHDDHAVLQQRHLSNQAQLVAPEWNASHSRQIIFQSLPMKTIPPPAGSPLHDVVRETEEWTVVEPISTWTSQNSSAPSSSSVSFTQIMSELYGTMCRQDAVTATHFDLPLEDESRFWTAGECLDHMRELENTATELALREETLLKRFS